MIFAAACAERFGWTPDQAEELPLEFSEMLFPMLEVFEQERQRRQKLSAKKE